MISYKTFNTNDKVLIVRRIADIGVKKCYIDIFKLLIKENITYTRNQNGIFFNVSILSNGVLNMIDTILLYHEKKKEIYINNLYN